MLIFAVMVLSASPAMAHKLHVWAEVDGATIRGEAYFAGGAAVQDASVLAFAPDGKLLGQAKTDSEGKFTFTATRRCDWRLVVNAGMGHGGEWTVKADELPEDLPEGEGAATVAPPSGKEQDPAAAVEAPNVGTPEVETATVDSAELKKIVESAVHHEIASLERRFQDFQQKQRFSDVLGGIGYIVGITGLLFYFFGNRKKRAE